MKRILPITLVIITFCQIIIAQNSKHDKVERYVLTVNPSSKKIEWTGTFELPNKSKEDIYNGFMAWTVKQSEPMEVLMKDKDAGIFKASSKMSYEYIRKDPAKGVYEISVIISNGRLEYKITNLYIKHHPFENCYALADEDKTAIRKLNPVFESIDQSMKNIIAQINLNVQ